MKHVSPFLLGLVVLTLGAPVAVARGAPSDGVDRSLFTLSTIPPPSKSDSPSNSQSNSPSSSLSSSQSESSIKESAEDDVTQFSSEKSSVEQPLTNSELESPSGSTVTDLPPLPLFALPPFQESSAADSSLPPSAIARPPTTAVTDRAEPSSSDIPARSDYPADATAIPVMEENLTDPQFTASPSPESLSTASRPESNSRSVRAIETDPTETDQTESHSADARPDAFDASASDLTDSHLSPTRPPKSGLEQTPFQFPEHLSETDLYESPSSANSHDRSSNSATDELSSSPTISANPIGLDFELPVTERSVTIATNPSGIDPPAPIATVVPLAVEAGTTPDLDVLFVGASESLVAKAVGSAEGTRTPDGAYNPAYYGHTDPGNGVWNLGSFSYQHDANSPEDADQKQLLRLRQQAETIVQKAIDRGLQLSLEEKLNGIDLANQAPLAALGTQGYVDWLAAARQQGLSGGDAILWARVRSFIDPHTQTWNAPGLGNSEDRITRDQQRRMQAISKAMTLYLDQLATVTAQQPPPSSAPTSESSTASPEPPERSILDNLGLDRFFNLG